MTTTTTDNTHSERSFPSSPELTLAIHHLTVLNVTSQKITRMRHLLGDCIHPCACGSTFRKIQHLSPLTDTVQDAREVLLEFADLKSPNPYSWDDDGMLAVLDEFIRESWIADGHPPEWLTESASVATRPTLENLLRSRVGNEVEAAEIIPGFLRRGERLMLTGFEGNGKTFLRDQWAVMYAAGVHPLTLEPIKGGTVTIFDLEGTPEQRIERLERLTASAEIFGNVDIDTVMSRIEVRSAFPFGSGLEKAPEEKWLTKIGPRQPDLIVIGPLYLMPGIDDLSTEEEAQRLIRRVNALIGWGKRSAVIMEHHSPHGDARWRPRRPYGHSSLLRWPEFGIHLNASGTFTHWRGDRRPVEWPAKFERGEEWPWMPEGIGEGSDAVSPTPDPVDLSASIVEFLEAHPGVEFTTTDLPVKMRAASIACRTSNVGPTAATLAKAGTISVRNGPRGARLYSARSQQEISLEPSTSNDKEQIDAL